MGGKPVRPMLEENRGYIITAYQSGKSLDDLAVKFSCSVTPIRRFLIDYDIPFRPAVRPKKLTPFKEQVTRLYKSGRNTRQIAQVLNVDRNTVSEFLNCLGIRRKVPLSKRSFDITGEANKGIFAGLLVGEGSIIFRRNGIAIRIVNQDKEIIDWLAQWGGRVYWSKPRPPRVPNSCGVWDLSTSVDVFHCLITILHYMVGAKRRLAEKAIECLKTNYGLEATPSPSGFRANIAS